MQPLEQQDTRLLKSRWKLLLRDGSSIQRSTSSSSLSHPPIGVATQTQNVELNNNLETKISLLEATDGKEEDVVSFDVLLW